MKEKQPKTKKKIVGTDKNNKMEQKKKKNVELKGIFTKEMTTFWSRKFLTFWFFFSYRILGNFYHNMPEQLLKKNKNLK